MKLDMTDMNSFFASLRQAPVPVEYTFYQDFQIADRVGGAKGVKETYERVQHWQDNPKAWGEVVCALNWRLWDLHETNEPIAKLYQDLWQEAQDKGWKIANDNKEYADIFFKTVD